MTMKRGVRILVVCLIAHSLLACAGIRRTENTFYVHAECVRVLGFPIPQDDTTAAWKLFEAGEVPAGAQVKTVTSTPADWTSLMGALGNILWIHRTTISGIVEPPPEP